MGDDLVGIVGGRLPFPADRRTAVPHKVPVEESRPVGQPEEAETLELDDTVDEEPYAVGGEDLAVPGLVVLNGTAVVAWSDDLEAVRDCTQPDGDVPDLQIPAVSTEIAGMDEDIGISIRNRVIHIRSCIPWVSLRRGERG